MSDVWDKYLIEMSQPQQHTAIAVVLESEQVHALGQPSRICQEAVLCRRQRAQQAVALIANRVAVALLLAAGGRPAKAEDEWIIHALLQGSAVAGRRGGALNKLQ